MKLLRDSAAFRRLWAAGAVSLVGDWLSFVAVAALALGSGGGPFALALVFAAHALPGAMLAPVAGAIVDGFDRRRVLVAADLLAALATLGMVGAAFVGVIAAIPLLLLVRSAIVALVPPGESAAVRRLVPESELLPANSILAATWSVAFVAGMALGGFATLVGPTLALALDAASFAIAAALHATLPALPVPARERTLGAVLRDVPRDTIAALRVAADHRPLLRAVLGKAPFGLAGGAGWLALNLVGASVQPFGAAALSFGILQAIRGAGTGIGPIVAARLAARGIAERALNAATVVLAFGSIATLAFATSTITLSVAVLAWGAGTGANWVLCHAAMQRHSNDAVIGRLAAFDELLVTLAMVASAFVAAAGASWIAPAAAPLAGSLLGALGIAAMTTVVAVVANRRRDRAVSALAA